MAPACGPRWRKETVTDRALRYRANAPECRPPGPRFCAFCGATRNVEVGHLDGHEEHIHRSNMIWNCRACNTRLGVVFKRLGLGRKTRQFNPEARGAETYQQWVLAVTSMKGASDAMTVPAAVEMIRATPPEDRSRYAREIWRRRREHYGPGGRYGEVPF